MTPRIFINIDTYSIGGPGKQILQFLKYGGKDYCNPVIAGFWRGPERSWQFRDAVEALGVRFLVLRQSNGFDPSVISTALRFVRDNGINILESHGYKSHIVCLALKKMTGLPWIAGVHGWTEEDLKVRVYNGIDKFIVRFADRIIPVSESLGHTLNLSRKIRRKMVILTNAVDFANTDVDIDGLRRNFGIGNDYVVFALVGRLSPEKGHRYFIEAFELLLKRQERIAAIFVGDGPDRRELERMIFHKGLSGRIVMAGYQEDVSSFYKACDVVVLPSLAEGMPNVALEAMMFAKPVIASHVGGVPEVVIDGKTGYLVEPANPPALADALACFVKSPGKRSAFGNAGKARVEKDFNPVTRVQKIMNIYKDVLAQRSSQTAEQRA